MAAKKDKGWSFEDESEDDDDAAAQQLLLAASDARGIKQLPPGEGAAPGESLKLVTLGAASFGRYPSNRTET